MNEEGKKAEKAHFFFFRSLEDLDMSRIYWLLFGYYIILIGLKLCKAQSRLLCLWLRSSGESSRERQSAITKASTTETAYHTHTERERRIPNLLA